MKVYELFADDKKNEVRSVTEYLKMKSLDHLLKKKHIFSGFTLFFQIFYFNLLFRKGSVKHNISSLKCTYLHAFQRNLPPGHQPFEYNV